MEVISKENRGIIILVRDSGKSIINNLIKSEHSDTKSSHDDPDELRIYGMGAQILSEIGVKEMILLTNTEWKFIGLDAYDIKIVDTKLLSEI